MQRTKYEIRSMKLNITKIALSILTILICCNISAQTSTDVNVRSQLDNMFEDLDKSRIPTGFLLDYAIDLLDIELYNGLELTEQNYVSRTVFDDIVKSIQSAAIRTHSITTNYEQILNEFGSTISNDIVNLKYTLFKYNYITSDALTENKIAYDESTGKVSDVYVDGAWINPYGIRPLFAFSPSAMFCTNPSVTYQFTDTPALRNVGILNVWFDAGDGTGYRAINKTAASIVVNYTTSGDKILKLRVRTTSGEVFESHAKISIFDEIGHGNLSDANTGDTQLREKHDFSNYGVSATVSWYSQQGQDIRKPIIVVEGFDPLELAHLLNNRDLEMGFTAYYKKKDYFTSGMCQSYGYDYIYVDWGNSLADIRTNAMLLIDIINWINDRKAEVGSIEKNIIIGQSMGGLITRCALTTMENNRDDHQVSTFVSHDVPHLGANIPLGLQYLLQQLLCFIHGEQCLVNIERLMSNKDFSDIEEAAYNIVNSTSAKQMMYQYLSPEQSVTTAYHDEWQNQLAEFGFPKGDYGEDIENLSIVNGRVYKYDDYLVDSKHFFTFDGSAKSHIFTNFKYWLLKIFFDKLPISDMLNIEWDEFDTGYSSIGSSNLTVKAEVNPTLKDSSNNGLLSSIDVKFVKKYMWLKSIEKEYDLFTSYCYAPSLDFHYDEYPGSVYSTSEEMEFPYSFTNSSFTNFSGQFAQLFTFIPSASALCIQNENGLLPIDYKRDYYSDPPIPNDETPFDSYYLHKYTSKHISLDNTEEQIISPVDWIITHANMSIDGPRYIVDEAQYSICGYDGTIEWSSSNDLIASIDATGKLTSNGRGLITITAQNYDNGILYRKTKDVVVGFPDVVISKIYNTNIGYKFSAKAIDEKSQELLDKLISEETLLYEWSVIDDNGNISTTITSDNYINFLPSDDEFVTVAVRLIDGNGNKSVTKSLYTNLQAPFLVTYKFVIIDRLGNPYFVLHNNGYEMGLPSHDLNVIFRELILNSTDNIFTLVSQYIKGSKCYLKYNTDLYNMLIEGVKSTTSYMWTFEFFNSVSFVTRLSNMMNHAGEDERVIDTFDLTICNSNREDMQKIPFVIIYNPSFNPSNN